MRAFLLLFYLFQQPLQEAVTLVRQGQFAEARKRLEGQPEPADLKTRVAYHRLRAAIAAGLRQYPQASAEMRQALSLSPNDPSLKAATAYALIEAAQPDEAVTLLEHSADSPQALTLLGIARYAQGEAGAAESSLNRAINADSNYQPAYRSLSQIVLESSSDPNKESAALLCGWNDVVCAALKLRTARSTGDELLGQHAIETLRKAPPENRVAHCALGQASGWNNNWRAAQKELEICVALDPTPQNHYRLAMAYKRLGNSAGAREQLNARARLLGSQGEDAIAGRNALHNLPLKK